MGDVERRVQPQLDVSVHRLRHRATFLSFLRKLLELVIADAVNVAAHGDRRGCDAGAGDELDLHPRVQTLGLVAGLGEAVGEGHAEARGVRRCDELFRARLAMRALRPARPGDRQLGERSALGLDMPAAARQVAFPRRIRPTDRSHVHPPLSPHLPLIYGETASVAPALGSLACSPQAQAEHRDHDERHDPPRVDAGRYEQGGEDEAGGDRGGNRPVVADDEVVPEEAKAGDPRPDQAHRYAPGLKPSTRRRSMLMYAPAVTRYSASRPRMAPSP